MQSPQKRETDVTNVTFKLHGQERWQWGGKMCCYYSLKQAEKIHDVLRVEFVPVSIQGVCM